MEKIMDNVAALMSAINEKAAGEERDDDLDFVVREIMHFPAYLNIIVEYVVNRDLIRLRYKGEEYRDRMTKLERDRRSVHIGLTDAVNKLNRLAKLYGVDAIVPVPHELSSDSTDDRVIALQAAFPFCVETFLDEMDRSGYNREASLDTVMKDLCGKRLAGTKKEAER